jgi:DNA polymerase III sliding clamp (beta) subunit (PCNA family)
MITSNFKNTLEQAKHFLMQQDFIAVLQHFHFKNETVVSYNDAQACQLKLNTGLNCTIPGQLLLKLLNTIKTEEVEIKELPQQNTVEVISGRNKSKLPRSPSENYVFELPKFEGDTLTIQPEVLEGLKKCLMNVSANPTRQEFNGVTWRISSDSLNLFSSDGRTISRFTYKDTYKVPAIKDLTVILPAFFCEKLIILANTLLGKAAFEMICKDSWALVDLTGNYIFTRNIEKDPPNYENFLKMFSDIKDEELWDIPSELEAALERAALFLDQTHSITTAQFEINGTELSVSTTSALGHCFDQYTMPMDLGKISFQVDPNLMLRAFKISKKMTFRPTAVVFTDTDFLHLIAVK